MKFSIIVPVYNVKDYLSECLESAARQTLDDCEIIVVDDGSTDGSGEMAEAFCREHERFRFFHKENGGLMSAWMYGVAQATGDYLGFIDSDDYVADDMFEQMYTVAVKTQADIVMCDRFDMRDGEITPCFCPENNPREGLYAEEDIETIRQMIFPLPGVGIMSRARWNKIFRRELFMENTRYCECLSRTLEDRYITPPCLFSAKRFYYLRKPLYYYRHRSGSNSGRYTPDLLDQIKRVYGIQKQCLEDKGLWQDYRENWEYLFMDYIRLYVFRNIQHTRGFHYRLLASRQLLKDDLVRDRLDKYGSADNAKLIRAVRLSRRLHSPLLLTLLSYL